MITRNKVRRIYMKAFRFPMWWQSGLICGAALLGAIFNLLPNFLENDERLKINKKEFFPAGKAVVITDKDTEGNLITDTVFVVPLNVSKQFQEAATSSIKSKELKIVQKQESRLKL